MATVMDFEENDLSFASILLGFRESSDSQDCENNIVSTMKEKDISIAMNHFLSL
jgi:hypothetical protein